MKSMRTILRDKKGQALPAFLIGGLAFMGVSAGAVDISRHAFTATELQNLADTGASAAAKAAGASYYCTMGSGGVCAPNAGNDTAAALAAAQAMAERNVVNGEVTLFAASDVVIGRYDGTAFTPGGQPINAVRATARKTIPNILGGIFGYHSSDITRTATASIVALGGGVPTMPIAIGEEYWQNCIMYGCPQPAIIYVPDGVDTAGWTTFFASGGQKQVKDYVPAGTSCPLNKAGSGEMGPSINVGDNINLANGQGSDLDAIQCYVCDHPATGFLVPVVRNTGQFNQTALVVGFATIVVEAFEYTQSPTIRYCDSLNGGGNLQRVRVKSVFNTNAPGPPGPGFFGSGYAQMVS